MTNIEVTINPGRIVVSENGVSLIADHDNVKVYEIDLVSKYPGDQITFSTGDTLGVILTTSDRTLYTDKDAVGDTDIRFQAPNLHNWVLIVNASRYTVRVAMYRYQNGGE